MKAHPGLDAKPEKDDVLYMTSIPWVSFTSFTHPMQFHPVDSVPRFAWGKSFPENDTWKMPLSVQGHHITRKLCSAPSKSAAPPPPTNGRRGIT
jgi:chloramphenicol O-acetyltransferase type A